MALPYCVAARIRSGRIPFDDEELELDYHCPAPVPAASLLPQSKQTMSALSKSPTLVADSSSQNLPWSSSPLEHKYPPKIAGKLPLKRESPESSAPALPPAKKRARLPPSFKKEVIITAKEEPEEDAVESHGFKTMATPAANKLKDKKLWDITHSAIKEGRKQLKNQNKKTEAGADFSAEEMRSVVTKSHGKSKKAEALSLSPEQEQVVKLVMEKKKSVFFTGPAGTGKSVLMRAIIAEMKKKWLRDPERLSVTASTGLAACNIGGMTLHSFAGIGLGKEDVPTLVKKIRRNPKAKNRWLRTSVLIVDEISMVDGDLFDKLAAISRTIRNNGRPWGGIQLIITGDFFQLPPVPDKAKKEAKFAFEAATWNTSIDHTIGLTQVFRQRDPDFANMLNEMRLGRVSEQTVQTFKSLSRPLQFNDDFEATELFPLRSEVDRSNEMRLRHLPGEIHRFDAADTGEPSVREKLLENMMAPKSIELKKGAQVMLIKNLDETLVNGSLGKIRGFMSESMFEATIGHDGIDSDDETRSKKIIKSFSRDSNALKDMKEYPLVQFTGSDGSQRTMLMLPEDWKVELPNGEVQAQRRQLPLILAWALSIHKAQGQTLERVKVDLGKVFEKGQAYVALSRATTKQGLQVLKFDKNKVMAHPRVISFYNKLYSADSAMKPKKATSISDFAQKGQKTEATFANKEVQRELIDLDEDEEEAMAAYG